VEECIIEKVFKPINMDFKDKNMSTDRDKGEGK
jgi:hypothetical protein